MAEKEEKKKEDGKEGEAQAPAAVAAASTGGKKKLLLIGGFVGLLLIAAGVPTVILLMRNTAATTESERSETATEAETAALAPESGADGEDIGDDEERLGAIAPLETFVVNLSGGRFLRVQVQLEFVDIDVPSRFVSRAVPIRDGIIALLTRRTATDLDSSKGREDLKTDIKSIVNELMRKEDVKRVYFTQFVIQ